MSKIASEQFESTLDYASLPREKLLELYQTTVNAYRNFYGLWQRAVTDRFGEVVCTELTAQVYPNLGRGEELERVYYEELNFLWSIMPNIQRLLTFARYEAHLLPDTLDASLDIESLSKESLVMLWNVATLTYAMQTGRWTDAVTTRFDQNTALKLERDVWLDYGGAEEDLRYGLIAAGAEKGNVETLFRGFQMAPGEVGLVEAEFNLHDENHGVITHHRCPAKDRFEESNKARLESSCVLCVIAMRISGEMVNEKMRCRAANIPPYREEPGFACQWEYWLD